MKRILSLCTLIAFLAVALTGCGLQVERPAVKEGSFDFSITYEIDGEVKTITGVYVCEFAGTDWALDGGYNRDWDARVESENAGDGYGVQIGTTADGGEIHLSFDFYPEYFMNDPATGGRDVPKPYLTVVYPYDDGGGADIVGEQDEIAERFGAKIISYEYAAPIENTYRLFDFS